MLASGFWLVTLMFVYTSQLDSVPPSSDYPASHDICAVGRGGSVDRACDWQSSGRAIESHCRVRRGPWFPWIPLNFEIYFQGLETPWKKLFLLQCPWIPLKTWEASDVRQCIVWKYLFVLNFPDWWCSDYLRWRAVFVSTETRAFPYWWKMYSPDGATVSIYTWYNLYSLCGMRRRFWSAVRMSSYASTLTIISGC